MANLANLDLESVEALLQSATFENPDHREKDENKSKKKKHKSRSRSRSRSHKKKHKKKSRSRSKSKTRSHSRKKNHEKERKRTRTKSIEKEKKEKKPEEPKLKYFSELADNQGNMKDPSQFTYALMDEAQKEKWDKQEEERKMKEAKALEEKMDEAKKQLEEARRDDCTVQITGLSIKTDEKAIYEFYKKHQTGKIRDIRIIKDPRSGKSKGIAYVEFYGLDSVGKSVALTGKEIDGYKVKIQASQAEKNRAAAAAKQLKANKTAAEQSQSSGGGSMRVFVSGLTDQLSEIEEKDIKELFDRFGDIERVELHRDDLTGKSKGYAFIVFRSSQDAKRAISEMNNFTVNGKQIKVQAIQAGMANMLHDGSSLDLEDDSGSAFLGTAQSRNMLMQKLQRDQQGMPSGNITIEERKTSSKPQTSLLPTNCILLSNMFDLKEVDLVKEPGYFVDLREEVQDEVRQYGYLESLFIEPNSEGNLWIKFKDMKGASTTYQNLNNKYFSGRKILCSYVTENTFNAKMKSLKQ